MRARHELRKPLREEGSSYKAKRKEAREFLGEPYVPADWNPQRTAAVEALQPQLLRWISGLDKLSLEDRIDLLQRALGTALADRKGQTVVHAVSKILELEKLRREINGPLPLSPRAASKEVSQEPELQEPEGADQESAPSSEPEELLVPEPQGPSPEDVQKELEAFAHKLGQKGPQRLRAE